MRPFCLPLVLFLAPAWLAGASPQPLVAFGSLAPESPLLAFVASRPQLLP